jgi:hypothetical protein
LLRVPTRFLAIYSSLRTLEPKTSKAFPSRWEPGRRCGKVTTAAPALLPAAVVRRRGRPQAGSAVLHRPRRQRAGARLRLFRGGARPSLGGASPHARRGPAHRRQHRQVAGASAPEDRPPVVPPRRAQPKKRASTVGPRPRYCSCEANAGRGGCARRWHRRGYPEFCCAERTAARGRPRAALAVAAGAFCRPGHRRWAS